MPSLKGSSRSYSTLRIFQKIRRNAADFPKNPQLRIYHDSTFDRTSSTALVELTDRPPNHKSQLNRAAPKRRYKHTRSKHTFIVVVDPIYRIPCSLLGFKRSQESSRRRFHLLADSKNQIEEMTLDEPLLPPDSSTAGGRGVVEDAPDAGDFRAAASSRRGVSTTVMDEIDDDEKVVPSSFQDKKDREHERSFAKSRIVVWLLQWVWTVIVFSTCDGDDPIMYLVVGHVVLLMIPLLYYGKLMTSLTSLFRRSVCNGRSGKASSSVDDTRSRSFRPCLMDFLATGVGLLVCILAGPAYNDEYATVLGLLVLLLICCSRMMATKKHSANKDDGGGGGGEHGSSKWEGIVLFCKSPFATLKHLEDEYQVELESRKDDEEIELQAQTERYSKHLAKRLKNPKLPSLKPYKFLVLLWLVFIVPVIVRSLLEYQGITMVVNYILYTTLGEGSGTQSITDEGFQYVRRQRQGPLIYSPHEIKGSQSLHSRSSSSVVSASSSVVETTTATTNGNLDDWESINKIECLAGKCKISQSLS